MLHSSILFSSFVVNHLQERHRNTDVGIAYIYCDYKQASDQTAVNLIANLLWQLVIQRDMLQRELTDLHREHTRKKTRPSLGEYAKLLRSAADQFSRVFIVINALDECRTNGVRESLIETIGTLNRASVLATSRGIFIEGALQHATRIDVRARDLDIEGYLEERISKLDRIKRFAQKDSSLVDSIKKNILGKAKGM